MSARARLTRRGWTVVGVVLVGTAMAYGFGAPALDALVVPCVVALLAAAAGARRAPTPAATRTLPDDARVGGEGVVTLRFDAADPVPARVRDDLPPGLAGDPTGEALLGVEPVRYRVRYERRGRHRLGPVTVSTTDVLGLVERRRTVEARADLLVYPRVRDLPAAAAGVVRAAFADDRAGDRDAFHGVREYVRGDPLRDVDWKASAKRDDLVVAEFAGRRPGTRVTVAVTGVNGRGDAMAEAAASLGDALLRAGVPVMLLTADGERAVDPGAREDLLAALATAPAGTAPEADRADVLVDACAEHVRVRIAGVETTFARLLDGDVPSADGLPGDDGGDGGGGDGDAGADGDGDAEVPA